MADPTSFVEHVSSTSNVVWIGDTAWQRHGPGLRPLAMPHRWKPVDRDEVRRALERTGAAFAQWTEGWDTPPSGWWYVCCDDREYGLGRLRKGPRHEVRKGLSLCEVRMVDPLWFASNGYAVYLAAFRHYGTPPPLSEDGFVREFTEHARYPGRETWGAFVGGTLVAWESCLVVGDASLSSSSKSDPTYHKYHPNNALVYEVTRHYLLERGMRYHSGGTRVLLHQTNRQEFRERMGYRKIYCQLRLEHGWKGSLIARLRPQSWPPIPLPDRLDKAVESLKAYASMAEIARSYPVGPSSRPLDGAP